MAERGKAQGKLNKVIRVGKNEINAMAMSELNKKKSVAYQHQMDLKNLGAKGPKQGALPMKLGLQRNEARRARERRQREELRESGMLVENPKAKREQKIRERLGKLDRDDKLRMLKGNRSGLLHGNRINTDAKIGHYRDGVLTISQKDIDAMKAKR